MIQSLRSSPQSLLVVCAGKRLEERRSRRNTFLECCFCLFQRTKRVARPGRTHTGWRTHRQFQHRKCSELDCRLRKRGKDLLRIVHGQFAILCSFACLLSGRLGQSWALRPNKCRVIGFKAAKEKIFLFALSHCDYASASLD